MIAGARRDTLVPFAIPDQIGIPARFRDARFARPFRHKGARQGANEPGAYLFVWSAYSYGAHTGL
jgi:hypothetical protein